MTDNNVNNVNGVDDVNELYKYKTISHNFFNYLKNNNDNDDEITYDINDSFEQPNNMKLLYDIFYDNNDLYNSFIEFVDCDYVNSLNYYENFNEKLLNEYIKNVFNKVFQEDKNKKKYILYSVKTNWVEALDYYLKLNYIYTLESYNEAFVNNNLKIVKMLWMNNYENLYNSSCDILFKNEKLMDLACKNASLEIINYLWSVDEKQGKNRCNHISINAYVNALSRKDNNTINVLNWLNNNTFIDTSNLFKIIYINEYNEEIRIWLKKYINRN